MKSYEMKFVEICMKLEEVLISEVSYKEKDK